MKILTGRNIIILIICIIFFTLGFLRINDLSIYTPDSARYLIVGNSLAHGKGFIDTTSPEPDRFFVQAPLYPIILAPIEFVFPLSITAAKTWTLLWGLFAIILFYHWISSVTTETIAVASTIFFAFNPLMLVYSTEVLSEAPFISFVLIALILLNKENNKNLFVYLVLSLSAVILLREVGIAFFIATVLYFFSKKEFKKVGVLTLVVGGLSLLWYLRNFYWIKPSSTGQMSNYSLILQNYVTNPGTPLVNELALRIWINLKSSIIQFSGMILYPLFIAQQFKLELMPSEFHKTLVVFFTNVGQYLVLFFTLPLIVYGIIIDFKNSSTATVRFLFLIIYYGLLLVYPVLDIRFLLLFIPLILYYIAQSLNQFLNIQRIRNLFGRQGATYLAVLILLIPNISGIVEILKLNLSYSKSPIEFYNKYGQKAKCPIMFTQPWSLLGKWVQDNLPEDVIIASPTKNLATFVGARKVLEIDQGVVQPVFEMLLRDNKVDYILSPSGGQDLKIYHFLMLESRRYWFEEVHQVANLHLYKVHSRLREPDTIISALNADTTSASHLLEKSRVEMLKGNYQVARELLTTVLSLDSTHPAILYNVILYYTLINDSVGVKYYYNKLYSLPQSLGFVMQARLLLQANQQLNYALSQSIAEEKAVELYNAASIYWKMGFYNRAAQIMNNLFTVDSTYFVGMLWGLHYNMFIGDTVMPIKYLTALKKIDSTNSVVKVFDKMFGLKRLLQTVTNNNEKSKLHTEIGILYKQIELNEESLDEAEFAIGHNPTNTDAWLLMAQIFERKSNLKMALQAYDKILKIDPNSETVIAKMDSIKLILASKNR